MTVQTRAFLFVSIHKPHTVSWGCPRRAGCRPSYLLRVSLAPLPPPPTAESYPSPSSHECLCPTDSRVRRPQAGAGRPQHFPVHCGVMLSSWASPRRSEEFLVGSQVKSRLSQQSCVEGQLGACTPAPGRAGSSAGQAEAGRQARLRGHTHRGHGSGGSLPWEMEKDRGVGCSGDGHC